MGAVRFELIGKVDGVPRVVVEHITRTDAEPGRTGRTRRRVDGCYRIKITGEPMMQVDFTHHGEHGDHNVCGMITTAQRIINALPAVVAAEPGLVTAIDLPLVTGRGLVSRSEHPRPVRRHRPGRDRHRRGPRARGRHRRRAGRGRRRRAHLGSHRRPARRGRRAGRGARPRGARRARPTSATSTRSPAWRGRRTTSSAGSTPWSTTSAAPSPAGSSRPTSPFLDEAFSFNVATAHALTRAAVPLMLRDADGQKSSSRSAR